jgi:hypothetical protein
MDGMDPDHVRGFVLHPRLKTYLGELCSLSLRIDVMCRTRRDHHPALSPFRIEVIDLHVDVELGAGDASTQVLFGEEGPVGKKDDRILKDLVLKRERERPVSAVVGQVADSLGSEQLHGFCVIKALDHAMASPSGPAGRILAARHTQHHSHRCRVASGLGPWR